MPSPGSSLHSSTLSSQVAMWGRHVQARELVRSVVAALGPEARVMPLKGVLLGALGLVDPALRPISDVDLLISGLRLRRAAARLIGRGFHICDVPLASGYLLMAPPHGAGLYADLHTTLMPTGLGRLSPRHLWAGAQMRSDLFGVPIWVPTLSNMAIHCITNIIKDRIFALPHNASDLAALLRKLPDHELEAIAAMLGELSLKRRAALALTWAAKQTADARTERLCVLLYPDAGCRRRLSVELERLEKEEAHPTLASRLRARAAVDSSFLKVWGPIASCCEAAMWPVRYAWFVGQERASLARRDAREKANAAFVASREGPP